MKHGVENREQYKTEENDCTIALWIIIWGHYDGE